MIYERRFEIAGTRNLKFRHLIIKYFFDIPLIRE